MTREQLNALVGLSVGDAADLVRAAGKQPRVYHEHDVIISISLPEDVVQLLLNDVNIVTSAETQASIDAKYQ